MIFFRNDYGILNVFLFVGALNALLMLGGEFTSTLLSLLSFTIRYYPLFVSYYP